MHFSNQQRDFSSMSASERAGIVAYFSMEIAIAPDMPTYSGGLGVLAGDTMRSAADLGLGLCAVTLLHRKGYFQQHLDAHGIQTAEDQPWPLEKFLVPSCWKMPWSR
jgi:glycogen phosphorylase